MLGRIITTSIPMTVFWMILSDQVNGEGFLVGFVFSLTMSALLLLSLKSESVPVHLSRAPKQLFYALYYGVRLSIDILDSGVDVTLRVLGIRPLRPGVIAVEIQLEDDDQYRTILSGLSAHGITITPGQLVVDFDNLEHFEGTKTMYVHCLDIEKSIETLDSDQTRRLALLKKVLGDD